MSIVIYSGIIVIVFVLGFGMGIYFEQQRRLTEVLLNDKENY